MPVSAQRAAEVLGKCARHCCICRRFRPLHLQVHHIVEQKLGGTDDLDNLIAICVSCHSDVHSNTKLTRRFTTQELKLHRNNVYQLIADGKLPGSASVTLLEEVSAEVIRRLSDRTNKEKDDGDLGISAQALDVLLSAVAQRTSITIERPRELRPDEASNSNLVRQHPSGKVCYQVTVGAHNYLPKNDLPPTALYPDFIIELVSMNLIKGNSDQLFVTEQGYAFADDVVSANPAFTTVRAKCLACGLHFVVCTWAPERHSVNSLYCPECGQHKGGFITWYKKVFGFIFQMVPGPGEWVSGSATPLKRKRGST